MLLEQASRSQKQVINLLKENTLVNKKYHSFWIVNLIIAQVDLNTLKEIYKIPNVSSIEIENSQFIAHPEFEVSSNNYSTPNGVENGLVAINATGMWRLGYTGRGRLAYNYDTGVWPNHPAFSNRFIGTRYPMNQSWIGYFNGFPNGQFKIMAPIH